jgi:hypothetical protein
MNQYPTPNIYKEPSGEKLKKVRNSNNFGLELERRNYHAINQMLNCFFFAIDGPESKTFNIGIMDLLMNYTEVNHKIDMLLMDPEGAEYDIIEKLLSEFLAFFNFYI